MAHYRLSDKNSSKGQPLDDVIRKPAENIAPKLKPYRQDEIASEQISNDMLRSSVEAASTDKRKTHIENPSGYLTSIYKRLIDKFLDREQKLVSVHDRFVEDLANASHSPSFEDVIHKQLLLEKLSKAMDKATRQISTWRLEGYSESEIARLLNTSPNTVSVRYARGLKKAVKSCFNSNRKPNNETK